MYAFSCTSICFGNRFILIIPIHSGNKTIMSYNHQPHMLMLACFISPCRFSFVHKDLFYELDRHIKKHRSRLSHSGVGIAYTFFNTKYKRLTRSSFSSFDDRSYFFNRWKTSFKMS